MGVRAARDSQVDPTTPEPPHWNYITIILTSYYLTISMSHVVL